jgi:hypothetical protein
MKPTVAYALLACTMLAAPAVAQDYYGQPRPIGAYDGYYDYDRPVPPRRVPGYGVGTTRTVVTTRRIISPPPGYGYDEPETVVTTRRVVAPRPVLDDDDVEVTGSVLAPPYPPPSPYRRVLKDETVVAPGFRPAGVVVTRRVAPAAPVIIEERRVETIRRVLRPGADEWLD